MRLVRRPRPGGAAGAAGGRGIAFVAAGAYPPPPGRPLAAPTLRLRLASIGYLHWLADLASPTGTAVVGETMAGLERTLRRQGRGPRPKLAAKIALLREMLAPIDDDLPGLRDRALLLVGFAGALRRAELAAIRIADLEACEHGLRVTLPVSKGDRRGKGVVVAVPYGSDRAVPGAGAAALVHGGRHQRRRGVPAHPPAAAAARRAPPASRRCGWSAARRSIPARWRASSRRAAPPPASTPPASAATA